MKVKQSDGKCEVTLSSSKLAKNVFIQVPVQGARFNDNLLGLLPGEDKKIMITSPDTKKEEQQNITVKYVRDTYN